MQESPNLTGYLRAERNTEMFEITGKRESPGVLRALHLTGEVFLLELLQD